MRKRLGRREHEVMQAIWERGSATVRDVWEALYPSKRLAYTTIATIMRTIETKGYTTHTVRNRAYVYVPTVGRADVSHGMVRDLIESICDGSAAKLVMTLIQQEKLSKSELEEIQGLIDSQQERD